MHHLFFAVSKLPRNRRIKWGGKLYRIARWLQDRVKPSMPLSFTEDNPFELSLSGDGWQCKYGLYTGYGDTADEAHGRCVALLWDAGEITMHHASILLSVPFGRVVYVMNTLLERGIANVEA